MITEYPVDAGVYDWAVASGAFRPSKPKHSEPCVHRRVTTAAQAHEHFTDGVRD